MVGDYLAVGGAGLWPSYQTWDQTLQGVWRGCAACGVRVARAAGVGAVPAMGVGVFGRVGVGVGRRLAA